MKSTPSDSSSRALQANPPAPEASEVGEAPVFDPRGGLPEAERVVRGLSAEAMAWPAEIEALREWIRPHMAARYPDAAVREGDLDQLVRIASQYASRERFLTELTLDPPQATGDLAAGKIVDGSDTLALGIARAGGDCLRIAGFNREASPAAPILPFCRARG